MHVTGWKHLVRVGAHRQVLDTRRDLIEAVVDAWRNDDHVTRPHLATLRGLVKCRGVAWPDDDLDDLVVGSDRPRVGDRATGDQRTRARDDVVDLGNVLVIDRTDRRPGLRGVTS